MEKRKLKKFENIGKELAACIRQGRTSNVQSEGFDILKSMVENAVHIGGGDFRINEKYLDKAKQYVERITD